MRRCSFIFLLFIAGVHRTACASEPAPAHYLVEALIVHEGELFLGQQLAPGDRGELMRAVAFDQNGQAIDPPDPGFVRLKSEVSEIIRIRPAPPPPRPLAETTHYYHATVRGGGVQLRVSDLGTGLLAPREIGEVKLFVFEETLFRIERVASAPESLRQDQSHYRRRIKAIVADMEQYARTLRERRAP